MTQKRLDGAQIDTGFQQMSSKTVTKGVDAVAFGDSGSLFCLVINLLSPTGVHLAVRVPR